MSEILLRYLVVQGILFSLLLAFFRLLYISNRTVNLQNRILKFSLHVPNPNTTSFYDKLKYAYYIFIKQISEKLEKSTIIKNYSKSYEKYVTKKMIIRDTAMNIVSNKFAFAIFGIISTLISDVFRKEQFDISKIILAAAFGFILPDIVMIIGRKKKEKKIEQDFLKAVIIMNNAFKSGRSIIQAIEVVAKELDGEVAEEFNNMYTDLIYGLDLEVVFDRFSKRINLEESRYMASSLIIINKTGGDIVKVFSSIEKSILARKRLNDELKSATALSNFVFKILIVIPFIIFLAMYIINGSYFKPFITNDIGRLILLIIIIIYILYILVVRRVMKVKE